jgi:hypothetical protein
VVSDAGDVLHMFTVYDNGADFPVPQWRFTIRDVPITGAQAVPGEVIAAAPTLTLARRQLPPGADFCLPATPGDDPTIVETWV